MCVVVSAQGAAIVQNGESNEFVLMTKVNAFTTILVKHGEQ